MKETHVASAYDLPLDDESVSSAPAQVLGATSVDIAWRRC